MKGVVFTGFFELVEEKFGLEMAEKLIDSCNLKSEGAYTSIGTYDHSEMVQLVTKLSEFTEIPVPVLLKTFAKFFGSNHLRKYQAFYDNAHDTFSFLKSIHNHIHVEVKKIYPDAELPHFDAQQVDDKNLDLIYTSSRKMSDFAEGLIEDTAAYYNEKIEIKKENLEADGSKVKFSVKLV